MHIKKKKKHALISNTKLFYEHVLFPCFQLVLKLFEKQWVSAKVKHRPYGKAMVKNTGIETKISGEHPNGKFSKDNAIKKKKKKRLLLDPFFGNSNKGQC